jgi:hypothetical protein
VPKIEFPKLYWNYLVLHKTVDNDNNQTLYAMARDWLRNYYGQGVTVAAVLVA